jgi:hypothetical protein
MKYNHAFDIAFEVLSNNDSENVTAAELRRGLLLRLANMDDAEIVEACGAPFDTTEDW